MASESFKKETRVSQTDFIRERKLSFKNLVLFLLQGVHRTLSVELDSFLKLLGKEEISYSKQALSKARRKIKHTGFIKINDTFVETYYSETGYKEYKDYRLIGIDGSMVELPVGEEIEKKFGKHSNKEHWLNSGWSMTAFDLQNEIIIESKLCRSGISEREEMIKLLEAIKNKGKQRRDIIVADRGFPSLAVFMRLQRMSYDYIIRYNGEQFLRELKDFAKGNESDIIVEVSLLAEGKRQKSGELARLIAEGAEEKLTIRVVKVELPGGTIEYLATSVLDKEVLTKEDLEGIYFMRWGLEEGFKQLKNTMELENLSSKSEETILQEYYCKLIMYNLHRVVVQNAQQELDKKVEKNKSRLKYERYKINENVSYGIVKNKVTELLNDPDGDWERTFHYLVKIVQKNPIPSRPNRHYERIRRWIHKFPGNKRRAT